MDIGLLAGRGVRDTALVYTVGAAPQGNAPKCRWGVKTMFPLRMVHALGSSVTATIIQHHHFPSRTTPRGRAAPGHGRADHQPQEDRAALPAHLVRGGPARHLPKRLRHSRHRGAGAAAGEVSGKTRWGPDQGAGLLWVGWQVGLRCPNAMAKARHDMLLKSQGQGG